MTRRQQIIEALKLRPLTVQDLSYELEVTPKTIADDLAHIARSLKRRGKERLIVAEPAQCLACNFIFKRRGRAGKPSKCPKCRSTRTTFPKFSVEE
ncbi:MAG: ArsR family transcriptional regulator [Candidatus Hodarchaeales archaeon]